MNTASLFLVGVGLTADAFAAALTQGVKMRSLVWRWAAIIALVFGIFQAFMPILGWVLASHFAVLLAPVDHWIAFGLLALIGGHMIYEALNDEENAESMGKERPSIKKLILLGIGTSIDAAAVGVSFAVLQVNIWLAVAIIGTVTFLLSLAAVAIGHKVGSKFRKPAEIIGGLLLIGLGMRILIGDLVVW